MEELQFSQDRLSKEDEWCISRHIMQTFCVFSEKKKSLSFHYLQSGMRIELVEEIHEQIYL